MTYATHFIGGMLSGFLTGKMMGVDTKTAGILGGAAAIGALLPDIDHPKSKISRSNVGTQITSQIASIVTSHRGFFHTTVFIVIMYFTLISLTYTMLPNGYIEIGKGVSLSVAIGMLSHLLLDTLNPGGIMWLWPVKSKHYHLTKIPTSSILEAAFCVMLLILSVLVIGEEL